MKQSIAFGFGILFLGAPVLAGGAPHIGDIGVKFEGGRIVTTIVEEHARLGGGLGERQRVFASELGSVEFGPFGNDEPGYTSDVLPAGASIGFNIRGELRAWDGQDFMGGITETMQFGKFLGAPGEITRATANSVVSGFNFATADVAGFIDEHLSQVLRGPETARGFAPPHDGIYLVELELTTDAVGIMPSEPYYIVFNLNLDQGSMDAAISYVERVIIPAPGVLAGLGIVGLAGLRRRRSVVAG